jgi:glutathione S-transferase
MAEQNASIWTPIAEARTQPGLRLVLTSGVPGPWGEAAKAVFAAKKIPYVRVAQAGGQENEELLEWTGRDNAPQAIVEDEPARTGWHEILELAERLSPDAPLLPEEATERVRVLGLCADLAGAGGFGWQRRLMLLDPMLRMPREELGAAADVGWRLGNKYGYSRDAAARAPARCAQTLELFSETFREQRSAGSRYLVGEALSAADLYWAAFAAMVEPLPHDLCPMSEMMRTNYAITDPALRSSCSDELLEHRDAIYEEVIGLPVVL